jgi:hypothetical protein
MTISSKKLNVIMKKHILTLGIFLTSISGILAFTASQSSITGKVSPADGATMVWAVSGTDSAKAAITAGAFALQVKPGTYKLLVDAKPPYKDVTLENLEIKEGQPLDVGEIVLQQ